MENYITAADAAAKTEKVLNDIHEQSITEAMDKIRYSADRGINGALLNPNTPKSVQDKLKELGYNVDVSNDRNETTISVSW